MVVGNLVQDKDIIDNYDVEKATLFNEQNLPWIVLLLGVFISVAAFVGLNIYASGHTEKDRSQLFQEVRQQIEGRIEYATKAIQVISLEQAVSPETSPAVLDDYYFDTQNVFEGIYQVREGRGAGLDWNLVYGSTAWDDADARRQLYIPVKSLFRSFSRMSTDDLLRNPVHGFLSDVNLPSLKVQGHADRLFMLASKSGGPLSENIVVGLGSMSQLVGHTDLLNRPGILRVQLTSRETGEVIYAYDEKPGWKAPDTQKLIRDINIGTVPVVMELVVTNTTGTKALKLLPYIFLVFGTLLTVVLLLYTRSKRDTENQIAALNVAVEQNLKDMDKILDERTVLEKSVKKGSREYKAIINSVSDIVFETDPQGEIVVLNNAWERITGVSSDDAKGQDLFSFIHKQDQTEQREQLREMVAGKKQAYRFFTKLRTADDSYRAVEMAMTMLKQDDEKNLRVVGTITDVEARHRAERALDETEKKYSAIVEHAAGGIFQLSLAGRFLSANPAMARILGYAKPEELKEKILNAYEEVYVNPRDVGRMQRELEGIGSVQNFETEIYTQDGQKKWVNVNMRAVKGDSDDIAYYEGSMEDVTKRRNAETGLREAKIQSDLANRAKSEFLANMSHELRTPLNAIIGFSEIIKDEVLGKVDNRQYWEYSRDIYDSGKKLLKIINEILDVSRIDVGDRQLNEGLVKTDNVVESCIEFLSAKAEEGGLVITNLTKGSMPHLVGEELAIKQIFINLLSNAVKYTPSGGRVTVSHEIDPDGRLRVSITDTGVGLDETEIEKALSPFGQIETALDRSGSGAGLGLTLADALIKLHGGKLELFSQKGIGTTATVIFPASRIQRSEGAGTGSAAASKDETAS